MPLWGLLGILILLLAFPACLLHLNTIRPTDGTQQRSIIGFALASLGALLLMASCVDAANGLAHRIVAMHRQQQVDLFPDVIGLVLFWLAGPLLAAFGARLMLGCESSRWIWLALYWMSYLPASLALVGLMELLNVPFSA